MITIESLNLFIKVCKEYNYSDATIVSQLQHFCAGVRDVRLCDNGIILLDGQIAAKKVVTTAFIKGQEISLEPYRIGN